MEDTLRVFYSPSVFCKENSLNPCFNGRYSQRALASWVAEPNICLNPCFNGRYSQSPYSTGSRMESRCLNPCFNGRYSQRRQLMLQACRLRVLILVLMEDTLRADTNQWQCSMRTRLNPCFNGRYSQRAKTCVPLYIVV